MARNEDKSIQALADELQRNQRIEIGIRSDQATISKIIDQYKALPSLYSDPGRLASLIEEIELAITAYAARAHLRGKNLAVKAINEFIETAERRHLTDARLAQVMRMNEAQTARRLDLYLEELNKEVGILKSDLKIFLKQGNIAGYTKNELLGQLVGASESDAGPVIDFEKRLQRLAIQADRRERAAAEIEQYRTVARGDEKWQWITVSTKPCPDCQPRAGKVFTFSEWQGLGLPGQGRTICGPSCRCKLMPLSVADERFPTVKEFTWNRDDTVLATAGELRRFQARSNRAPQNE